MRFCQMIEFSTDRIDVLGQCVALAFLDPPAHDVTGEHVQHDIELEELTTDRCGELRDVPRPQIPNSISDLFGHCPGRMRRETPAVTGELVGCCDPIPAGTGGDIRPFVQHDRERFTHRQVRKVLAGQLVDDLVLLTCCQPSRRHPPVMGNRVDLAGTRVMQVVPGRLRDPHQSQ